MPSIHKLEIIGKMYSWVLNLVISGIPSILVFGALLWLMMGVLNLIITGLPSILVHTKDSDYSPFSFKP